MTRVDREIKTPDLVATHKSEVALREGVDKLIAAGKVISAEYSGNEAEGFQANLTLADPIKFVQWTVEVTP